VPAAELQMFDPATKDLNAKAGRRKEGLFPFLFAQRPGGVLLSTGVCAS
jgi:hypothetical protein